MEPPALLGTSCRASGPLGLVLLGLGLLLASSACSDDETVLGDEPPTEIAVDPLQFLGDLPCSDDPGAAKSYVATLTDVTDGTASTLAASPPAPCSSRMGFRFIVVGHEYTADVDVYDVPATELFPAGGAASGSRVMRDAAGAVVAPRWRTHCGGGPEGGAISVADTSVVVAGCEPLDDDGTAVTSIRVDPRAALPDLPEADGTGGGGGGEVAPELGCATDGGAIDTIVVIPSGPGTGTPLPSVTVACGDPVVFSQGIVAGEAYTFRLEAREEGSDVARWAASCAAVAAGGVERTAECGAFTSSGTISISTASLEQVGFLCGTDFEAIDVTLDGETALSVPRTSCAGETLVAPVPSGHYTGSLNIYAQSVIARTASCEVDVAPQATSQLDCTFD